jgi:hypothetical protein
LQAANVPHTRPEISRKYHVSAESPEDPGGHCRVALDDAAVAQGDTQKNHVKQWIAVPVSLRRATGLVVTQVTMPGIKISPWLPTISQ